MAFGLVIPGIFNNVLRSAREGSDYLVGDMVGEVIVGNVVGEVMVSNMVGVLFFPEKVIKFYKMAKVKVSKNSFTNVICAGEAYGLSRVIKYSIISKILNLLLTVGIAELYLRNIFLGK